MRRLLLVLAAVSLGGATYAEAQRFSIDFRPVVARHTANLPETDLTIALGVGGTLAYRLQQHLHVYAGWDWVDFRADESFVGADADFVETGYTLGLRFAHPLRGEEDGVSCRVDLGATYKHVEIENSRGELVKDTGHETGFEGALGLYVPVATTWRLAPAIRYRYVPVDITGAGSLATSTSLRYVGVELGASLRF